ncbi:MAG: ATP-binding protein [Bryobacteraceae bacterium]
MFDRDGAGDAIRIASFYGKGSGEQDDLPRQSFPLDTAIRWNLPGRMSQVELEMHPAWRELQDLVPRPRGWLAGRLVTRKGQTAGLLCLSDANGNGDFTADDEVGINQFAAMVSLALESEYFERVAGANARSFEVASRRMDDVLQKLDVISWEANSDGLHFTSVSGNVEKLLGIPPARLIEEPELRMECVADEDRGRVTDFHRSHMKEGRYYTCEYRAKTADGRVLWLCDVVSGVGRRRRGVTMNVTERKELEERLLQTQKTEGLALLSGTVAHDFNNLLTAILGGASLALDSLSRTDPARPILENVLCAGERASEIAAQLLNYSGRKRSPWGPIDLSERLDETARLIQASISKKVRLNLDLARDLPPVAGDSAQIQQVLMNLLINAGEAIGEAGGDVYVATRMRIVNMEEIRRLHAPDGFPPGEYVSLEVRDTGCGMDEATRERIFNPFFTTKATGRGLGLAAVVAIVYGHNGALHVTSAPFQGTRFEVLLPVSRERPADGRVLSSLRALSGKGTILVVDDEEVVRNAVKASLERYGYDVLLARNGLEAVAVFREAADEVALIVLDLFMPSMSGAEALEEMLRIRPGVRALVFSGLSEMEALKHFTVRGVSGFIQKPHTAAQLAAKVKGALSSQGSHR